MLALKPNFRYINEVSIYLFNRISIRTITIRIFTDNLAIL